MDQQPIDNNNNNNKKSSVHQKFTIAPANNTIGDHFIDLDDIFAEHFFPPELDFSSFLGSDNNDFVPNDFDYLVDNSNQDPSSLSSSSLRYAAPGGGGASSSSHNFRDNIGASYTSSNQSISGNSTAGYINNNNNVIMIPPSMPKVIKSSEPQDISSSQWKFAAKDIKDESKSYGYRSHNDGSSDVSSNDLSERSRKQKIMDPKDVTDAQKTERRERNREHAKKSRIRKKVLLDSLQDQLTNLRSENVNLRRIVVDKIPHLAGLIFERCTTEESMLLHSSSDENNSLRFSNGNGGSGEGENGRPIRQHARILMEPDFRLIQALITSQQNFVLSDPSLPDNPIVYCSEGFCNLTQYKRQDVLGRNCRFLQGPGTDQAAVDILRQGVSEGRDVSVCLLNYKADGSPFWNQFFVAALRDSDGAIVNFVGVQVEVNSLPVDEIKDRVKKLPIQEI